MGIAEVVIQGGGRGLVVRRDDVPRPSFPNVVYMRMACTGQRSQPLPII